MCLFRVVFRLSISYYRELLINNGAISIHLPIYGRKPIKIVPVARHELLQNSHHVNVRHLSAQTFVTETAGTPFLRFLDERVSVALEPSRFLPHTCKAHPLRVVPTQQSSPMSARGRPEVGRQT